MQLNRFAVMAFLLAAKGRCGFDDDDDFRGAFNMLREISRGKKCDSPLRNFNSLCRYYQLNFTFYKVKL